MTPEQIKALDDEIARAEKEVGGVVSNYADGYLDGLCKAREIMGNKDGGKNAKIYSI